MVKRKRSSSPRGNISFEHMEQIMRYIEEVFWLMDWKKQSFMYISPAYEHIWHRPVAEIYDDATAWMQSIHPEDIDRVEKLYFGGAAKGEFDISFRIILEDGRERWVHARGFPIKNEHGEVYRIAGISRDVTESNYRAKELTGIHGELQRIHDFLHTYQFHFLEMRREIDRLHVALRKAHMKKIVQAATEQIIAS